MGMLLAIAVLAASILTGCALDGRYEERSYNGYQGYYGERGYYGYRGYDPGHTGPYYTRDW